MIPQTRKRKRQDDLNPIRNLGTYERRKATSACLVCRARKTKCDNVFPTCGCCQATGGECQYAKPANLRFDQATLAILKRLDELEKNLVAAPSRQPGLAGDSPDTHHGISVARDAPEKQWSKTLLAAQSIADPERSLPWYLEDEGRFFEEPEGPPPSSTLVKASSMMRIEAMLHWPIFRKHLDHASFHREDKELQFVQAEGPSRPRLLHDISISSATAEKLLASFVVNILPSSPILDPAELRFQMQEMLDCGISFDGKSCLCLLALALGGLGSLVERSNPDGGINIVRGTPQYNMAEEHFQASQMILSSVLCETSLLASQCAFFTAVYLSFTMRIMASWKAFAQASTQCLAYLKSRGLMRSPAVPEGQDDMFQFSPADAQAHQTYGSPRPRLLQESLYWVILKGEAEICVELGLPGSALHECSYPHVFPHPPADVFEQSSESDRHHLTTGWLYYLGEIALKRIQNRALHFTFSLHFDKYVGSLGTAKAYEVEALRSKIAEFDEQLERWRETLPAPLYFSIDSTEQLHDHLRWVLRGHRLDVVEILRFPALYALLNPPNAHEQGRISPVLVQLAEEYLSNAVQRIEVNAEEFLHRHQGAWLTIRGCTRSALALLGAKLLCQEMAAGPSKEGGEGAGMASFRMPDGWRDAVLCVLKMLRAWQDEAVDVARLRFTVETLLDHCRD